MSKLCICEEYEGMFTEGFRYVESLEKHDKQIRADAIDELVKEMELLPDYTDVYDLLHPNNFISDEILFVEWIRAIAEQLKDQNK